MKTLILAGGRGTRLWPLSRKQKPKQFQKLLSKKTMLQETFSRLKGISSASDIFISTNEEYRKEVKKNFPGISSSKIIAEPANRERVAAIALFLAGLKKDELDEPVLIIPSDHLIKDKEAFKKSIFIAEKFVKKNQDHIAILGEKPIFPDTGLGYVKKGKLAEKIKGEKVYKVDFFKEKPNLRRARSYVKTKNYFWNIGIYVFMPSLVEKLIREFIPDNYKRYKKIREAIGKKDFKKVLKREYPRMDNVSFEYAVLENYENVAILPINIGWSDVGSWTVLKNCLSSPDKSFIKGHYVGVNSKNVMVYGSSKRLVAGVGIKDLVIAATDDIILVCHKDESQKVKQVIKKLEKEKRFDYI